MTKRSIDYLRVLSDAGYRRRLLAELRTPGRLPAKSKVPLYPQPARRNHRPRSGGTAENRLSSRIRKKSADSDPE